MIKALPRKTERPARERAPRCLSTVRGDRVSGGLLKIRRQSKIRQIYVTPNGEPIISLIPHRYFEDHGLTPNEMWIYSKLWDMSRFPDRTVRNFGRDQELKRGQVLAHIRHFQRYLGLDYSAAHRAFQNLKTAGLIDLKPARMGVVVTVLPHEKIPAIWAHNLMVLNQRRAPVTTEVEKQKQLNEFRQEISVNQYLNQRQNAQVPGNDDEKNTGNATRESVNESVTRDIHITSSEAGKISTQDVKGQPLAVRPAAAIAASGAVAPGSKDAALVGPLASGLVIRSAVDKRAEALMDQIVRKEFATAKVTNRERAQADEETARWAGTAGKGGDLGSILDFFRSTLGLIINRRTTPAPILNDSTAIVEKSRIFTSGDESSDELPLLAGLDHEVANYLLSAVFSRCVPAEPEREKILWNVMEALRGCEYTPWRKKTGSNATKKQRLAAPVDPENPDNRFFALMRWYDDAFGPRVRDCIRNSINKGYSVAQIIEASHYLYQTRRGFSPPPRQVGRPRGGGLERIEGPQYPAQGLPLELLEIFTEGAHDA